MKKNTGFTLVELLGVLVLLAVISIITVPTVNRLVKGSRDKSSLIQEEQILNAAKSWGANNVSELPKKGLILVNIQTLIDNNFIEEDNIDEISDSQYSLMCVKIRSNTKYNTYDYSIVDCSDNLNEDCFTYKIEGIGEDMHAVITEYTWDDINICPMDVVIPSTLGGYNVEYIGDSAFLNEINSNKITSVDFSFATSLVAIEHSAFENNSIAYLDLSMLDNLDHIGGGAFENNLITNVLFNDNTKEIYGAAFAYNNLSSLIVPKNIEIIYGMAFYNNSITGTLDLSQCLSLIQIGGYSLIEELYQIGPFENNIITKLILPNNVKLIGDGVFLNNSITEVNIPSSVEMIGKYAFSYNSISSTLVFPSSLTEIKSGAFLSSIYNGKLNFTNATSLRIINDSAFGSNILLSSGVDFSNASALETIEQMAFRQTELTFADFSGATSLKNIELAAFYRSEIPGTLNLANSLLLENLGETSPTGTYLGAFEYNNFTNVILPDVAYMLNDAVFRHNLLSSINLGTKVTKIGDSALAYNSLTSFNIPGSVLNVYDNSLAYNLLTNITINLGVNSIYYHAFYKYSTTSNVGLTTITNLDGKSFDWYNVTGKGSAGTCTFITGTCGDITIN